MQQLNILPINVSQKVELKDESSALISTSTKDDFSQHVDLHLAKNKGATNNSNQGQGASANTTAVDIATNNPKEKLDDETSQTSTDLLTKTDEPDTASHAQEVAATGKEDKKRITAQEQEQKLAEQAPVVDESELLMSFLLQADQTLVLSNSGETTTINGMSAEQKAKYEAQLLLKSSGLVADLSAITQALNTNSEVELNELKQAAQTLHGAATSSKTKPDSAQVEVNSLLEGESLDAQSSITAKVALSQALAENKPVGENATAIAGDEQVKAAAQQAVDAQLVNNDLAKAVLTPSNENINELDQAQVRQQQLSSLKNAADDDKLTAKSPLSEPGMASTQPSFATHQSAIEKSTIEKSGALTANNNNSANNKDELLASIITGSETVTSNKNSSQSNLAQGHLAQGNRSPEQVKVSTTSPNGDFTATETHFSTKSVEYEIAQNKSLTTEKNNDAAPKIVANTSTDFSIDSDLADITSRASQVSQNIADQQANDIFNPRASSEVSQSQKTNIALHHETISMFRKDFADAVKDKVMLVISQKLQQFDITLDPPELGNIHVKVNLQGEQASVNFVVQNQQAKEAFEQNMHKLKELLAEQGVDVGDTNVEQQSQQSDNNANNAENTSDNNHKAMANTADASDVIEHNLSASLLNTSTSAVDYYA